MLVSRVKKSRGRRLYFNDGIYRRNTNNNLRNGMNILVQLRLYRWAVSDRFEHSVGKRDFIEMVFPDVPTMSLQRIGRILGMVLMYTPNYVNCVNPHLRIPSWRFANALDVHYGIENLIQTWLPLYAEMVTRGEEKIETREDMLAWLGYLLEHNDSDDLEFIMHPAITDRKFTLTGDLSSRWDVLRNHKAELKRLNENNEETDEPEETYEEDEKDDSNDWVLEMVVKKKKEDDAADITAGWVTPSVKTD